MTASTNVAPHIGGQGDVPAPAPFPPTGGAGVRDNAATGRPDVPDLLARMRGYDLRQLRWVLAYFVASDPVTAAGQFDWIDAAPRVQS
jgi:hypothetical protein